jgi:hypothetical protein
LNGEGLELPVKVRFSLFPFFAPPLTSHLLFAQMEYDLSLATSCYTLAARWLSHRHSSKSTLLAEFSSKDVENFSATQKVLFLETLGGYDAFEKKDGDVVETLGEVYGFRENKNPEILVRTSLPFPSFFIDDNKSSTDDKRS